MADSNLELKELPAETSFAEPGPAMRPFAPTSAEDRSADMSSTPPPSRRDIAFDWLLRVQQAPQDEHLQRDLVLWQMADQENAKVYAKARQLWRLTEQLTPITQASWPAVPAPAPEPAPPVLAMPVAVSPPPAVPRRRRSWLQAALGGAIAAGVLLAIAPDLNIRLNSDFHTATAERRQVQLPDGSQVYLDSDSAIAVDFSGNHRDVQLLRGQAFFEVQPDPSKPFNVHAQMLEITVTGTAFNVDAGSAHPSVAVQHGSVRVAEQHSRQPFAAALQAGQRLIYAPESGEAQLSRMPVTQIAAWRNGQLVADNLRLGDVVEQMRRYLPGKVIVRDASLADARITGVYDISKPAAALRAVVQPHGGQVTSYGPFLLVLSRP